MEEDYRYIIYYTLTQTVVFLLSILASETVSVTGNISGTLDDM
jgi:hypothetical protein